MNEQTASSQSEARDSLARLAPSSPVEVPRPREIRTDRLLLRSLTELDHDEFLRAMKASHSHLERFSALHMPGESDEALFRRQLHLTREGDRTGRAFRRAAFGIDGRLTGAFNLNSIRRGLASEADCNWWLTADAIGRGLATEALLALLGFSFADLPEGLGLHRVMAGIQPDNEASRRLARRVGFSAEEPGRTFLHAGGKWDLHEMHTATPDALERARRAG